MAVHYGFDCVLDDRLGLIMMMVCLKVNGSRNMWWQHKIKRYRIVTRTQCLMKSVSNALKIQNLMMELSFVSIITLLIPITCLLLPLDLYLKCISCHGLLKSDVYLAQNLISWIKVWSISFDVNISSIEACS